MLKAVIFHPFSGGIIAKCQNSISLSGAADTYIPETQRWKNDLGMMTLDEIKTYIARKRKTGFQYGSKYISHDLGRLFILISDKFWFMKIIKNMKNEFVKVHAGRRRYMQAMI